MDIKNLYAFLSAEEKIELMDLIEKDYEILNLLRTADPITGIPRTRIDHFININKKNMSVRLLTLMRKAINVYEYTYIEDLKRNRNFSRMRFAGKATTEEFLRLTT